MSALSLISALFVGVTLGVVIMSLMIMAKDRVAENEGAAIFAEEINARIAMWGTDESAGADHQLIIDIREMCESVIERAGPYENNFDVNSTNG